MGRGQDWLPQGRAHAYPQVADRAKPFPRRCSWRRLLGSRPHLGITLISKAIEQGGARQGLPVRLMHHGTPEHRNCKKGMTDRSIPVSQLAKHRISGREWRLNHLEIEGAANDRAVAFGQRAPAFHHGGFGLEALSPAEARRRPVAALVSLRCRNDAAAAVKQQLPDLARLLVLQLQASSDDAAFPYEWECMDDGCLDGDDAGFVGVVVA